MFSSRIGYNFPIMDSIRKRSVRNDSSEIIIRFTQEDMSAVFWELNFFWRVLRIPRKIMKSIRTIHQAVHQQSLLKSLDHRFFLLLEFLFLWEHLYNLISLSNWYWMRTSVFLRSSSTSFLALRPILLY